MMRKTSAQQSIKQLMDLRTIGGKPTVDTIDWINAYTWLSQVRRSHLERNGAGRWSAPGACKDWRETEEQTLRVLCMIN
jgi:hypothetical protein